jgi:hypothetical protein
MSMFKLEATKGHFKVPPALFLLVGETDVLQAPPFE